MGLATGQLEPSTGVNIFSQTFMLLSDNKRLKEASPMDLFCCFESDIGKDFDYSPYSLLSLHTIDWSSE